MYAIQGQMPKVKKNEHANSERSEPYLQRIWLECWNALGFADQRTKRTMNVLQAKEIVKSAINDALGGDVDIHDDTQLIGGESLLDSMKLVEVCLALEDLADEHGFEFDWTSGAAMSKSRSIFRNFAALSEEFAYQSEA